jgi:hypothetical protein
VASRLVYTPEDKRAYSFSVLNRPAAGDDVVLKVDSEKVIDVAGSAPEDVGVDKLAYPARAGEPFILRER